MCGKKIIMAIDDDVNLTKINEIMGEQYDVRLCRSAKMGISMLERSGVDMILLDIEMPEMDGYEAIRILKTQPHTRDIPVIFLTSHADGEHELKGLELGAVDYISKPFSPPLLKKRVELHLLLESQNHRLQEYNNNLQQMVEAKTQKALRLQDSIMKTVAGLIECRDGFTGSHIERTQLYLKILMTSLIERGIYWELVGAWDMKLLLDSSQLHDVGKIAVKDSILMKPGKLDLEEFEEMKKHVPFGVAVIEKIQKFNQDDEDNDFFEHAKIFAAAHHEKWDGSGYPLSLAGENIPLQGRLMAIADVYDALTSQRSYKKAFSHDAAVQIMEKGGAAHFDPMLTDIFLEKASEFKNISGV
ncbi:MAG: response regulator [Synergistaceae bacterium]|nr:response regulator [Synergistaceae bacterium]